MMIYRDFSLKEILYYKIGGKAKFLLKIENREDFLEAFEFIKKEKPKRVLPLGLGSNVLVNDKFFDGVVLWFCQAMHHSAPGKEKSSAIKLREDNLVEAFAAESLDDLINFSFDHNLTGFEWAGGLPSTVGGAVRGNVGAFGGEIKDTVKIVEIADIVKLSREAGSRSAGLKDGFKLEKLTKDQLEFAYRDSIIKRSKDLLVVSAEFQLRKASKEEIEKARQIYLSKIDYRNKNHPMDFPSCGSVFKNITKKKDVEKILMTWGDIKGIVENKWYNKVSMGYVIDRLGFSGFEVGGAKVSEKHANYIVNFNKAKFIDVMYIIKKIKEKFYKTFGFHAELEIEVVE